MGVEVENCLDRFPSRAAAILEAGRGARMRKGKACIEARCPWEEGKSLEGKGACRGVGGALCLIGGSLQPRKVDGDLGVVCLVVIASSRGLDGA